MVALEKLVPVRAPHDLDDVPARAPEYTFELVDDALVAAYRPVQPLQIAVDDEDEVVQLLAGRHGDRTQGVDLVSLTVSHKGPNLAFRLLDQAAVFQIAHEACLVERIQRPNAHRDGGKAPEIRHQPWVRIGR